MGYAECFLLYIGGCMLQCIVGMKDPNCVHRTDGQPAGVLAKSLFVFGWPMLLPLSFLALGMSVAVAYLRFCDWLEKVTNGKVKVTSPYFEESE